MIEGVICEEIHGRFRGILGAFLRTHRVEDLEDEHDPVGRGAHLLLRATVVRLRATAVRRRRCATLPGEGAAAARARELQHGGGARGLPGLVGDPPLNVEAQSLRKGRNVVAMW